MTVNVNIRITPFGQVVFEVGKPTPPTEISPVIPAREEIYYYEPVETVLRIYEIQYQKESTNYVVPPSTA